MNPKRIYLSKNPDILPFSSFEKKEDHEEYMKSYHKVQKLLQKLYEINMKVIYYKEMEEFEDYDQCYQQINSCDAVLGIIHGEYRMTWRASEIGDGTHMGEVTVPVFLYFLPSTTTYKPIFSGFNAIALPSNIDEASKIISNVLLNNQRKKYEKFYKRKGTIIRALNKTPKP